MGRWLGITSCSCNNSDQCIQNTSHNLIQILIKPLGCSLTPIFIVLSFDVSCSQLQEAADRGGERLLSRCAIGLVHSQRGHLRLELLLRADTNHCCNFSSQFLWLGKLHPFFSLGSFIYKRICIGNIYNYIGNVY